MKVRDVMTGPAICCGAGTNVGSAVQLMWENNCGLLPVVGADGKLIGVVSDRDICIAMGTRSRVAGDLTVGEIATKKIFTCVPEDEIHEALQTIANNHVRRLPVVDDQGALHGVLSIDDVVRHGDLNKWEGSCELSSEEIIRSLKKLYAQKSPVVHTKAMAG